MSSKQKKNEKIGILGERFIQQRLDVGMTFDEAWEEWKTIQAELHFMLVDCPEVRFYNDPNVCDAFERRRIRSKARHCVGRYVKSANVARMSDAAVRLNFSIPTQQYKMDEMLVRGLLSQMADDLESKGKSEAALYARSDDCLASHIAEVEHFANTHSLWAVPPTYLWKMWANHESSEQETLG